jgi:phage terminase small subunit
MTNKIFTTSANMAKLTPKQLKFCEEYLVDLNGTQAAIRAGYSAKTAQQQSADLLLKPVIQTKISELRQLQQERTQIEADKVVEKLWKIANFDIRSVCTYREGAGFEYKPLAEWDDSAIAVMNIYGADKYGNPRFRAESRLSALESLGKHLGMYSDFNTALACLRTYGLNLRQDSSGSWTIEDLHGAK